MKSLETEAFDRRNYFPLHAATFVLVFLSFLTVKEIIPDSILFVLIGGTFLGFWISWRVADNKEAQKWIIIPANIFSVIIVIWLVYLLLHTEFLYVEIIRVLIKALIAVQLLLSFVLFPSKRYDYIQIGTIFLVLGSIVIKWAPQYRQPVILILYLFMYMGILRLRFLIELKKNVKVFVSTTSARDRNFRNLIGIVILFSVLMCLSRVFFLHLPQFEPYPYGMLPSELIGPPTVEEFLVGKTASFAEFQRDAAQPFYDSKMRLNRELNKLVDRKRTEPYQKEKLLNFSLELLKEDIPLQEIQEEILKLKKFLATSDLDLSQTERDQLSSLADEYIRNRIDIELEELGETLKEKLAAAHLNTFQKLLIFRLFIQLQNTNQHSIVSRIVEKAHEKIEKNQLLLSFQKEDLKDMFNGLFSVKTNQITMDIMGSTRDQIKGMSGLDRKERNGLNMILLNIETSREMSLLKEHLKEMKNRLDKFQLQGKIGQDENNRASSRLDTLLRAKALQIASNIASRIKEEIDSSCEKPYAKEIKNELKKMKQAKSTEEFQKRFSKMKDTLEEFKKQGIITTAGSDYIENQLKELFQAELEGLTQHLEKEFVLALEKEDQLISSQKERLKEQMARLNQATTEQQAKDALGEITQQLEQLNREGRIDYATTQMLKQRAEEIFDTKFPEEAEPDIFRPEKVLPYSAKGPFSTFCDEAKKLNISSFSEQNLEILIEQLQKSSSPIHVRQTLEDISNQLESLLEKKEISASEKEMLEKKAETLAKIKEEMVKAALVSSLKAEIERLEDISQAQKDELKDAVEQMASKSNFEDLEESYDEIIEEIEEMKPQRQISRAVFKPEEKKEAEELMQDWEIEIIPSIVLSCVGKPFPLTVIGIYKGTIIHDLTKEVVWEIENQDIVSSYGEGVMIPFTAGRTNIKAVWLENISSQANCIVMPKIPDQEVKWLYKAVP